MERPWDISTPKQPKNWKQQKEPGRNCCTWWGLKPPRGQGQRVQITHPITHLGHKNTLLMSEDPSALVWTGRKTSSAKALWFSVLFNTSSHPEARSSHQGQLNPPPEPAWQGRVHEAPPGMHLAACDWCPGIFLGVQLQPWQGALGNGAAFRAFVFCWAPSRAL